MKDLSRNVILFCPICGNNQFKTINKELGDLLPFEELDVGKSFDIKLVVYNKAARKFYVVTKWQDSDNNYQTKRQMVFL